MIEIAEEAVQQLREFKERRGPGSCVRIGILSGSTTGPTLGVTIDERNESDELFSYDGFDVIVDKALLSYCRKISVEFVLQEGGGCSSGGGFKITPSNPV